MTSSNWNIEFYFGSVLNVYEKCKRKSSIFWILSFFLNMDDYFCRNICFHFFFTLWTFFSESSSKVNHADSPLPHLPSFALSIRPLSRDILNTDSAIREKVKQERMPRPIPRDQSEQGLEIDRDLRLSCWRKVIWRVYTPLCKVTFIPFYVILALNLAFVMQIFFRDGLVIKPASGFLISYNDSLFWDIESFVHWIMQFNLTISCIFMYEH